jgi:uncharacterized membrane protein YoaK (UPF0700 family)
VTAGTASAATPRTPAQDHRLVPALLALTVTTGFIDAVSYLGLGRVFTANMTGNVVLLGFGLAGAGGLPVVAPLVSLGAYVVGAGAGGRMALGLAARHDRLFRVGLLVEAALLACAAIVAAVATVRVGSAAAYATIALLAAAMGVRNAVVRRLAVPDLTTTVLTMTITWLAADAPDRRTSARRLAAVVAMLGGAVAGALLQKQSLSLPLALAAAFALGTLVSYQWHRR